jgi:hypothetical protein
MNFMRKLSAIILFVIITFPGFAQGKFFPTYYIKYGSTPAVTHTAKYSAQFDLIIAGYSFYDHWSEGGLNSWETLKKYNPNIKIALYQMGPSEYDITKGGSVGDGWAWIRKNHGADAGADRWTASGYRFPYLSNSNYPEERLMYIKNPDWQKYWIENTYKYRYVERMSMYRGADAIFSDNTNFIVAWPNDWYDENNPGKPEYKDHPKDYATKDGVYNNAAWKKDMKSLLISSVKILDQKPVKVKMVLNFGYMGRNPEYWVELDTMKPTVWAAMEEGAFTNPWSKTFTISDWETKIKTMKNLKNIVALMNNTGRVKVGQGLGKMDTVMTEGNMGPATGWDALWFSMTSFLMALNKEKSNGIFGFTIWGYGENYYLDEYNPEYLHLGKPLGDYYIPKSGPAKDIAFREYEDGWVVTNKPHTGKKKNVPVPKGKAYIVNHSNLKDPCKDKPVTRFDIGENRGIILLKEGKKIGNQDNK